jgi:hypothetical protein
MRRRSTALPRGSAAVLGAALLLQLGACGGRADGGGADGEAPPDASAHDATGTMDATPPPDAPGPEASTMDGAHADDGATLDSGGLLDSGGSQPDGADPLPDASDPAADAGDATAPPVDGGPDDGGHAVDGGESDSGSTEPPACVAPDGGFPACSFKLCEDGKVYQCGNCIDDDMDGFIDDEDPNCLGPCDHNEAAFDLRIPGNPLSGCNRDCYFDSDSGSGNDNCDWALQCDPLTPIKDCCDPGVHDGMCMPAEEYKTRSCASPEVQVPLCHAVCLPLTPNGCDCFGCCDIRTYDSPDQEHWVYIGSYDELQSGPKTGTCDLDAARAGDTQACRPCTPQSDCVKPCGECQLCLGKTELPAHCTDPEERCPGGQQVCGAPGDCPCPAGHFCLTGCCVRPY